MKVLTILSTLTLISFATELNYEDFLEILQEQDSRAKQRDTLIEDLLKKISNLESKLDNQSKDYTTLKNVQKKNTSEIAANTVTLSNQEKEISSLKDTVNSNQDAIALNIQAITMNNIALTNLMGDVGDNSANIAENKEEIAFNNDDIYELDLVAGNNTLKIDQLYEQTVTGMWDGIQNNTNYIKQNIDEIISNQESIDHIIDNNNLCIDDFYTLTDEYCGDGPTLRKLPLWGGEDVSEDEINFEYPTQRILNLMSPDVKLESIQFRTYLQMLSSVILTFSDGSTFEATYHADPEFNADHDETISFDTAKQIRAVESVDDPEGAAWIYKFLDEDGVLIKEFNPYLDYSEDYVRYDIEENEELIGVYGVKGGEQDWFSSFGFIVKVNV